MSRIGWTRGMKRFGNGFIFVFVLGFCFGTVAASASCVLPALPGPWLCILNMQQPHAARTIKHLEMVATAGHQQEQQQKRLSQPCERIYELATSGSCNMRHGARGKGYKHSQIWRASNHFNANKAQQMALRVPCKLTHDWPRGGGMPQNWQRQRGPKMDACGSLSGTRKMLPGLCMPTGHPLPACGHLWHALLYLRLPPFVCTAVVDACNWNFCRIYQSATGAVAACGKAMCCR